MLELITAHVLSELIINRLDRFKVATHNLVVQEDAKINSMYTFSTAVFMSSLDITSGSYYSTVVLRDMIVVSPTLLASSAPERMQHEVTLATHGIVMIISTIE